MSNLKTVQKVGSLLDLFSIENHTWGVSQAAEELNLPRSSTHALFKTMEEIGLLQVRGRGRYSIGWRVLELAEILRSRSDLKAATEPILTKLVQEFRETAHLAVLDRMTPLYLNKIMGTHNIIVQGARIGARFDAHCTAVGKVLLAFQDTDQVKDAFNEKQLTYYTPATITNIDDLLVELEDIRRIGHGFDRGEQLPGMYCVAVPIRNEMGAVVAAMSLSTPEHRFLAKQQEMIAGLKRAASEVRARLEFDLNGQPPSHARTPEVKEASPTKF